MGTFTPEVAAGLRGPAWLRECRIAAAERFAAAPLPDPSEEIWRYSRIADLDLDAFRVAPDEQGYYTTPSVGPPGIDVAVLDGEAPEWPRDLFGSVMTDPTDVFAEANTAFTEVPIVVRVPAGVVVDGPVVVEHELTHDGTAAFPRLIVEAGPDSEVTVVERFTSTDVHALIVPVLELHTGPSARVRYVAVNELGPRVWQIGSQVARGERDSTTLMATVALGGDYARIRTDARLVGQGATGDQIAVYFGEGRQMHDFRTLQDHAAPKTTSNLLFKGAVQDHSRSVYTGLIRVRKEAPGTNAFQTNRNIKLSEGAWAESVPNLEIENNDVRCSHASAVGPIDEEQRFYLESRGVPPKVAERLIVLGFFDEVLQRLPVPGLIPELRRHVAAKLARRSPDD